MTRTPLVRAALLLSLSVASATRAGDLTPPPGPIAPTMKNLDRVEPRTPVGTDTTPGSGTDLFRITQSGSYYLTSNIAVPVGTTGIQIASSDVTLDLNGFTMGGGGVPGGTTIASSAGTSNITVRNGHIEFCNQGVMLSTSSSCIVVDISVRDCASSGILVGPNSVVERCAVRGSPFVGFSIDSGSTVTSCTATGCTNAGFFTSGAGVTLTGCSAFDNIGPGFLINGGRNTVHNCTATTNRADGFRISSECFISGCTAARNGNGGDGAGILVIGNDVRIEGNNCTGNDRGIDVNSIGNFIARNTCSGNTTNWDVVAGNVILVVNAATAGVAVVGNAGGVAPGSTDPNANFTY